MKILYGVQGTGNGHIARARAMACALKEKGLDVDFFFSGRDASKYFSMQEFGDFKTGKGLSFVTENGRVNYLKTVMGCSPVGILKEIMNFDLSEYDLVINDFEPISAWAAKKAKIPCIGISHQNAFRYEVPQKGKNWLDTQIIKSFAPSDIHIGLHWYHFDQPILPPIVHIAPTIHAENTHNTDQYEHVLVYLPFEAVSDVVDLLSRFTNTRFICYHPDVAIEETIKNVTLRKPSHTRFQEDLHQCEGVIANGGFELPSEALSLGKKLLLKPLSGQFEQESNVATLEHLGLAHSMEYLSPTAVKDWLDIGQAERVHYPNVAKSIVNWIADGKFNSIDALGQDLWDQVDFPDYVTV